MYWSKNVAFTLIQANKSNWKLFCSKQCPVSHHHHHHHPNSKLSGLVVVLDRPVGLQVSVKVRLACVALGTVDAGVWAHTAVGEHVLF